MGEGAKSAKTAASSEISDFEATLAMLPPRLAARLSLGPTRDASPQVQQPHGKACIYTEIRKCLQPLQYIHEAIAPPALKDAEMEGF